MELLLPTLVAGGSLCLSTLNTLLLRRHDAKMVAAEQRSAVSLDEMRKVLEERDCMLQRVCELHNVLAEVTQTLSSVLSPLYLLDHVATTTADNAEETRAAYADDVRHYARSLERLLAWIARTRRSRDSLHALHMGTLHEQVEGVTRSLHLNPDPLLRVSVANQRRLVVPPPLAPPSPHGPSSPAALVVADDAAASLAAAADRERGALRRCTHTLFSRIHSLKVLFHQNTCYDESARLLRIAMRLRSRRLLRHASKARKVHATLHRLGGGRRLLACSDRALRKRVVRDVHGPRGALLDTIVLELKRDSSADHDDPQHSLLARRIEQACRVFVFRHLAFARYPELGEWYAQLTRLLETTTALIQDDIRLREDLIVHNRVGRMFGVHEPHAPA